MKDLMNHMGAIEICFPSSLRRGEGVVRNGYDCVVLKKVDTIITIFFSLCYFLSFVESVDKLKTHAAYLAEGVW